MASKNVVCGPCRGYVELGSWGVFSDETHCQATPSEVIEDLVCVMVIVVTAFTLLSCSVYSALKSGAICSIEMSVDFQ
jgi:hypothetical protein